MKRKFNEKMAFSAKKLAPYQLPRRIEIYKSLPLLSNGKIDGKVLFMIYRPKHLNKINFLVLDIFLIVHKNQVEEHLTPPG